MIGFLFVSAVVLVVALLAFRMIPAYIEYYTVQRALEKALAETNDPTLANVRRAMERKLNADYVDAVTAKDVDVVKQRQQHHRVGELGEEAAARLQREPSPRVQRRRDALTRRGWPTRCRERLGYAFRKPDLLRHALTHRSYGASHNERLEFVGDAVLNCVVGASAVRALSRRWPKATCRAMRASLVNQETLARVARTVALGTDDQAGRRRAEERRHRSRRRSSRTRSRPYSAPCSSTAASRRRATSSPTATATCWRAPIPPRSARTPRRACRNGCRHGAWRCPSMSWWPRPGEAHAQTFDVECRIPALDLVATGRGSSRRARRAGRGRGRARARLARGPAVAECAGLSLRPRRDRRAGRASASRRS